MCHLPKKVPKKKIWIGMPAIGELRFTNQLGTRGVSLRKSMNVNRVDLFSSTFFTNLYTKSGLALMTHPFRNAYDWR